MAQDAEKTDAKVLVGRIAGPKGIKGDVRIDSYTEAPKDVAAYGPVTDETGTRTFKIRVVGEAKGQVIARLSGVEDRTAAEVLKGMALYVAKSALPAPEPGEYYAADLIGLEARTVDGAPFGKVVQVHDYGAGPSLEIAPAGGGAPVLVPFTAEAVPTVDIGAGWVEIDPPEGLLEPPERPGNEDDRE